MIQVGPDGEAKQAVSLEYNTNREHPFNPDTLDFSLGLNWTMDNPLSAHFSVLSL